MIVAVVGSRTFADKDLLTKKLDEIQERKKKPITKVVSGGASGADTLAEEYAKEHDIPVVVIEPEWNRYGRAAGPKRNAEIVDAAEIVVAFWDGVSRGTKSTIELARKRGKRVVVVNV
jgi:hypothetical protein